jgi:beta-N-acetylhexosaminidase
MNRILLLALILAVLTLSSCFLWDGVAETTRLFTREGAAGPADGEEAGDGVLGVPSAEEKIEIFISEMTLEEKIGQMFFLAFRYTTRVDGSIENMIRNYGIGGVVLFGENIIDKNQTAEYINRLQGAANIPLFISIDEEGGRVLRTRNLDVPRIPNALSIGQTGDPQRAYNAAETIAGYLLPLGFNMDFAPVADVFTNPRNTVIGDRAFSTDADMAGEMVKSFTQGLLDNNILPALKHFPGHGDTIADSHFGIASTNKTLDELKECEFMPFIAGIEAGAPLVMTGHISAPNITGDNLPATFSYFLLTEILRGTLGFDGIIITDALEMGAVTRYFSCGETAVKSISAGVDMLLMPRNFEEAYNSLAEAVRSGEITEERINESVRRILTVKYNAGLINQGDN